MIVIVNYGVGNLRSVANMLRKAGASPLISSDPADILAADKLILPGVGHFDYGMKQLHESGLVPALNKVALEDKKPVLGICLGAQLLGNGSEEGSAPGLGWIDMQCHRFPTKEGFRVPHMMWNSLKMQGSCCLLEDMERDSRYYFVHSYYLKCADADDCVATTQYGMEFTSVVMHDNIVGMQFHPEKSLKHGLAIMRAFDAWSMESIAA